MLLHPQSKSILLRARDPAKLKAVLAGGVVDINYEGHNVAVRHTLEAVKILRNMGVNAPSPIIQYYRWPGKYRPFAHQKVTAEFSTLHKRHFIFNEMGTAKTNAVLWAADYLMSIGMVQKAIVIGPLSTMKEVWAAGIFETLMHRNSIVLHADRERRKERLNANVDFYIINHDGVKIIAEELIARKDINLFVIDESAFLRNSQTERWKLYKKVLEARPDAWIWFMTGTPCPQAPTDAWAQAKLLFPDRGPAYFGEFRRQTMIKVSDTKWIPAISGYAKAFNLMQPAIRFKKAECLDLPPVTFSKRTAELSPEQIKLVREMKKDAYIELNPTGSMAQAQAHLAGGTPQVVTAANAADKLLKIRQILAGSIKVGDGEYTTIDHAPRLKVLRELIDEAGKKVVIVAPFKGLLYTLRDELAVHGNGFRAFRFEILNGDLTPKQRSAAIERFKTDPDVDGILCHPRVMAHGLNFTEADTTIYYAPIDSNEQYQQAMERMNRPGQTSKMTVVNLGAHPIEWDIYAALNERQVGQLSMLDLYKKFAATEL